MIHVKKVSHCLWDEVSPVGQEEIKNGILPQSRIWEVCENNQFMCYFGLKSESLIGPGIIVWFVAGKNFAKMSRAGFRTLRRTMNRIRALQPRFIAYVREDLPKACRMARFFGFRVAGQVSNYKVYELCRPIQQV